MKFSKNQNKLKIKSQIYAAQKWRMKKRKRRRRDSESQEHFKELLWINTLDSFQQMGWDLPFIKAVIKQNLLTGKVFSFIELLIIWFSKIKSLFFQENNTKKVQVAQLTLGVRRRTFIIGVRAQNDWHCPCVHRHEVQMWKEFLFSGY